MYDLNLHIPLREGYDVIVAGGGPAGCAAAAASAREGARTLLLEATGSLGGMGTGGRIPFWCGFSNGGSQCGNGLSIRVLHALQKEMAKPASAAGEYAIDSESLKRVYDDLVLSSGAEVLFHTMICNAQIKQPGRVRTLIAANKAGLCAYRASVYIDCTGDADLVALSGGEFEMGDRAGEVQPSTMCFTLTGVDPEAYKFLGKTSRIVSPDEKYPLIIDDHSPNCMVGPGAVGFNAGHIHDVNGTDPASVSAALPQGRKLVSQICDQLANRYPEVYGNAYLAATADRMGTRESRRIVGDYRLTEEDYIARRTFEDDIALNCYGFDSHETKNELKMIQNGEMDSGAPGEVLFSSGESHGIPYRCLLPRSLVNVLAAGRCISAERRVFGSIRVMANCLSMGEAAGIAAALAAEREDCDVHRVDAERIRQRLREEGAKNL